MQAPGKERDEDNHSPDRPVVHVHKLQMRYLLCAGRGPPVQTQDVQSPQNKLGVEFRRSALEGMDANFT